MRGKATACCAEERQAWREEHYPRGPQKTTRFALMKSRLKRKLKGKSEPTAIHPDPIAATHPSTSFLDLPLELRELVYEHYMTEWSKHRLTPFRLPSPSGQPYPPEYYYKPIPPHEPPLTRTCRIIRKETCHLFYATHRFPVVAHADSSGKLSTVSWYDKLEPARLRQIRHLEIYFCFEMKDRENGFRIPKSLSFDVDYDPQFCPWWTMRNRDELKRDGSVPYMEMMGEQQFFENQITKAAQATRGELTARDVSKFVPDYTFWGCCLGIARNMS